MIKHVTTVEAREHLANLVNQVVHGHERVVLTRRGKEIAAIVPLGDLKLLEDFENQLDLQIAADSLKESREFGTHSLDQLKEELG